VLLRSAARALTSLALCTAGCAVTNEPAPTPALITTGPLPNVGCDYTTVLSKSCAISGCHTTRSLVAGLDLTPDATFRQRVVDVIPTHGDIDCGANGVFMACNPPPPACPPGAKLVDRENPDASWALKKLDGTQTGCGDNMPLPPGDAASTGWGPDAKACLETFFRALAANK